MNRAGAVFHPQLTATKLEQEMQTSSFQYYWSLAKRLPSAETGVQILPMKEYFDDRTDDDNLWYKSIVPDYRVAEASSLPQGCTFGVRYTTLAINPLVFLPWLKTQLERNGVKFVRKEVVSLEEARKLTKSRLIINASGVGAKELAGDLNVKPVRGQTMFIKTDFNEFVMKDGAEYTYVIPRAGSAGVIVGGIKTDRLDAEVDVELRADILRRVNHLTNGTFREIDLNSVTDIVGFRPGREGGTRVERDGNVIHAYGVAGFGYVYSFGLSERVRRLVEQDCPNRAAKL